MRLLFAVRRRMSGSMFCCFRCTMKRKSCAIAVESLDVSKKQRLDNCAPLLSKDLPVLSSGGTCKPSGKRTACCLEPTQSEVSAELEVSSSFSFWKRFRSNLDDPAANRNLQPMSCSNAESLNNTRLNFGPNDEFNCFNYWRMVPSEVELEDFAFSSLQMEQGEPTSAGPSSAAEDEFNSFNYWKISLPNIDGLH